MNDFLKWFIGTAVSFAGVLIVVGRIVANVSKRLANTELEIETMKEGGRAMETRTNLKIDALSLKIRDYKKDNQDAHEKIKQNNDAAHGELLKKMALLTTQISHIGTGVANIQGYLEAKKEEAGRQT